MHLRNKITSYKSFLIGLFIFLIFHALLFNFNVAEWGDSYRILRSAEFLRDGAYPEDEKRPPLFAAVLAVRPDFVDRISWGRFIVFAFALASFYVFYLYLKKYVKNQHWQLWGLVVFSLNSVYLYWSLRIMADVPFSFLVLLIFYLYLIWKNNLNIVKSSVLGLLTTLAVLTRFEGYLVIGALGLGVFIDKLLSKKKLIDAVFVAIKDYWLIVAAFLLTMIPYVLWRNPLNSKYFEEPTGRTYDLKMILIYLISVVCLLSLIYAVPFLFKYFKSLKVIVTENLPFSVFVFLELVLILLWPAAIPRLFVPVIPFILILFIAAHEKYFENQGKLNPKFYAVSAVLLVFYVVAQFYFKLQFLIVDKKLFVLNVFLQIALLVFLAFKKKQLFMVLSTVTLLLWTLSVLYIHKNIFVSVKHSGEYAGINLKGNIGYNDVSSVSDWYINYMYKKEGTEGFYYNTEKKENLNEDTLKTRNIDYLIITNEHNTTMTLDLKKRPYLKEIKIFKYNVNGQEFITRIVEVL